MKRNLLKVYLLFVSMFTVFSCSASPSVVDTPDTSESIPTAKQWNKDVVGWNLGNEFECSAPGQDGESMQIGNPDGSIHAETAWGNPVVTKKMIQAVKKAGFNAIRIPIRWQCHITNAQAMSIDKAWIARIKEVVGWCLDNDLKVIINAHHEKWLEGRPTYQYKDENCQKLALLWMNISSEFANYDSRLLSPEPMRFTSGIPGASLLPRTSKCRMLTIRYSWIWFVPQAATMPSATSSYRLTFATLGLASRMEDSSFRRMPKAMATTI